MNAKRSNIRHLLRIAAPLLIAAAAVLAVPDTGWAQQPYRIAPSHTYRSNQYVVTRNGPTTYYHHVPVQAAQPQRRIIYFRGTDGRIYGTVAPSPIAPQAMRQQQLPPSVAYRNSRYSTDYQPQSYSSNSSGIVIEDATPEAPVQRIAGIPAAQYSTESSGGQVNTSARAQAEETLRRFEKLQGIGKSSESQQAEKPSDETKPDEPVAALPPPKAY